MTTPGAGRLRVVYYTRPAFLDHSLPFVRALAERADVHLLLELSPEERAAGVFGEARLGGRPGVRSARGAVRDGYLREVRSIVAKVRSFDQVLNPARRAFAPASLLVSARAAWHVRSLRPSVIHFEDVTGRSAPLLVLTPGVPKVVAIHDARTHLGERAGRAEAIRRLAVQRATRLLFFSRFSQTQFGTAGTRPPSTVIPLGPKLVWSEHPGRAVAERAPTLLFFGRLSAYKGLDVLYAALPAIAAAVPGLRVVIAGRPNLDYRLPDAPRLPAGATLETCFAQVDGPTVRRLFGEASAVVLPYLEASQSGVVQTAFAFDTPVIASAVGGLPEAIEDGRTGRLVPPADPAALAAACIELLGDAELRARMRERIHSLVTTELSWDRAAEALLRVYADMEHAA
jgi:glycosyltransferase involved in cell wall biosynthesis